MRTEQQLREALSVLASAAGDPEITPAAGSVPARHRRTRATVLLVAAVLIAAVLVPVALVLNTRSDRTSAPVLDRPPTAPPTAPPTPTPSTGFAPLAEFSPLRSVFSLDPASGYVLVGRTNTTTVQSGYLPLPDRRKAEVDVLVHAPGSFDPTTARTGTPITVQGTAGFRGPVTDPETGLTTTADVWPYAPDAWAEVTDLSGLYDGATAEEELGVANAVRISSPAADLPVPFVLSSLPTGLVPEVVSSAGGDTPAAGIGFSDDLPGDPKRAMVDGGALTVSVGRNTATPTGPASVDVDGRPGWLIRPDVVHFDSDGRRLDTYGRELVVDYGGDIGLAVLFVDPTHVDRYDDAALVTIARGLRPAASLTDRSGWTPAADAVPRP